MNAEVISEAILFASMQFAIGSVEMSSKFSVRSFAKDQETLQSAADALVDYLKIGAMWALGVIIFFYFTHGYYAALWGLLMNLLVIGWLYHSYMNSFRVAIDKYGLQMPILKFY